ncbi:MULTISPECIES: cytochrome b [Streptomyces]|uniref:cytochrome bc1 complex cytochrome b subunit n=1 Tax=Streptomyces TaxID=1883 RepID=UPI00099D493A|nr:ubiquinol-cytochrome c reductase cytochrome b subunit [Streptomyces durhamensis]
MSRVGRRAERLADAADARLPVYEGGPLLRKAFPDHWSFLLGELALYSLLVLILTGVWLTLFFQPEMREVVYAGRYVPLRGVRMSAAFDSTLYISFDVRGGLLMRQAHHWAALVFVAAIGVHLLRIFFTGAFRRPRELNWVIGVTLFAVSLAEGFAGYSLPDDLLSGTGLRIAQGIMLSLPVVGTYVAFFAFGGQYPGHDIITRLYPLHVLLLPGALIALVAVHLMLVVHLKHTQWRGPGHTQRNAVGKPFFPQFTGSSGGLAVIVAGVLVLLAGIAQINPVWNYGPYRPDLVSTASQPDWYVGFLEGALRLVPAWETNFAGHTLMWNVLLPAVVLPALLFAVLYAYPFVEQRLTGEGWTERHLCDRPRERPVRTGLGVAGTVFYGVLLLAGGNDVIAQTFRVSVNVITWVLRTALIVAPVLAFLVTRWLCRALTAAENERLAEGVPTGEIRQSITGGYEADHEPVETFRPGAPRRPLTAARTGTPSRTPRVPERPDR